MKRCHDPILPWGTIDASIAPLREGLREHAYRCGGPQQLYVDRWWEYPRGYLRWVESHPGLHPVRGCPRGDWLLRVAQIAGYQHARLLQAASPTWARAVRDWAPAVLETSTATEPLAARLRAIARSASPRTALGTVRAVARDAYYVSAPWDTTAAAFGARNVTEALVPDLAWPSATESEYELRGLGPWAAAELAAELAGDAAEAYGFDRAAAEAAEHARCAREVLAALPDLTHRVRP